MIILIPAKINSKSIKYKNLKKIGGISLLENTINFAKKLSKNIYVSTESKKIEEISLKKNCLVHFRKGKIAKSDLEMKYVIKDFINKNNLKDNLILLLQPTSPFRKIFFIKKALEKIKSNSLHSVISANQISNKFLKTICLDKNLKIIPTNSSYLFKNRQDLPKLFFMNGNFFLFKSKFFLKEKEIPTIKSKIVEIKFPYTMDIDNQKDLINCRKIYKDII